MLATKQCWPPSTVWPLSSVGHQAVLARSKKNHDFAGVVGNDGQVRLEVYDADFGSADDLIGSCVIDMCVDMCIDMRADMCVDACVDMCVRHVCRHVCLDMFV